MPSFWDITPLFRDHSFAGRSLIFFDSLDSTNLFLLKHPELLKKAGLVVATKRQTAGIGRKGRKWEEGCGRHLCCSFVVHSRLPSSFISSITLIGGLSVYEALLRIGAKGLSIKWPNDILINGKKVCGILCQKPTIEDVDAIIIGIGVNISGDSSQFSKNLHKKATTLEENGIKITRHELLKTVSKKLEENLRVAHKDGLTPLISRWKEASDSIGKRVRFLKNGDSSAGTILDIDFDGALIVRTDADKILRVESGEIEYREYQREKPFI